MNARLGLPAAERILPVLLVMAGLSGCSSSAVVVEARLEPVHENLMKIGTAYVRYNNQNGKPPTKADQIRSLLKEFGNPDDLLRSPRDGEALVICWGVDLSTAPKWATSTPVLAYEKKGVDGNRYVLATLRNVVLMSDAEFKQASFPPGHRPQW